MDIEAVIFDKDGVLTDSEKLKATAWQSTLQSYGVADGFQWYLKNLGPSSYELARLAQRCFSFEGDASNIANEWTTKYRAIEQNAEPIKSNLQFLASISGRFNVAIASSMDKASIESEIKRFGYEKFVKVCVSGEDVPNNKPAPDVYFAAAALLGIHPTKCVVIEDSPTGIEAAKAAGMVCVGFKNPLYELDLSRADEIVNDLRKIDFASIAHREGKSGKLPR